MSEPALTATNRWRRVHTMEAALDHLTAAQSLLEGVEYMDDQTRSWLELTTRQLEHRIRGARAALAGTAERRGR